jgi:hypothetical protein
VKTRTSELARLKQELTLHEAIEERGERMQARKRAGLAA